MITDIVQGLNANHKGQSSMLKIQRISRSRVKKYIDKTIKEKTTKRAKNELFKHPCKYFVIK